jgi:hypothetical protein
MSDLDEQQERLTLALYGGALAAIGVLVVAFLFYVQSILPLIAELNQTLAQLDSPAPIAMDQPLPEAPTAQTVPDSPTDQPAPEAQTAAPHTQLLLLLASTTLGGLMVGWALAGTGVRGAAVTGVAHLPLALLALVLGDALVDASPVGLPPGAWFILLLLLVPGLTVLLALLAQHGAAPGRRLLLTLLSVPPLVLAALLVVWVGWWIVPATWVILPLYAVGVPALLDRSGLTAQTS